MDDGFVEFYLDIAADDEIAGITLPTNSTLYRREVDRNPVDLCDIPDAGGFDILGEGEG